jgi:hypothetical protein
MGSGLRVTAVVDPLGWADPLACAEPLAEAWVDAWLEAGFEAGFEAGLEALAGAPTAVVDAADGLVGVEDAATVEGAALPGVVVVGRALGPLEVPQPASTAAAARTAAGASRRRPLGKAGWSSRDGRAERKGTRLLHQGFGVRVPATSLGADEDAGDPAPVVREGRPRGVRVVCALTHGSAQARYGGS